MNWQSESIVVQFATNGGPVKSILADNNVAFNLTDENGQTVKGTSQKAIYRAGLTVDHMDLIELNEAFASQSIACIHDLGLDLQKINVNGGSIALGHPLGCSGVRISTTLVHEMRRRNSKYGLATMCVGVGQGAAVVFEGTEG